MLPAPASAAPRRSDILAAVQRSEVASAEVWASAALGALAVGLPPGVAAFADGR